MRPAAPPGQPLRLRHRPHRRLVGTYLTDHLDGRPFTGPDALAHIAQHHPATARTHDRRITALTQYYEACKDRGAIRLTPDLTMLRSGVDRDATPPRRLTPMERNVLLTCIGMWGPDRDYRRDRLIAYLSSKASARR